MAKVNVHNTPLWEHTLVGDLNLTYLLLSFANKRLSPEIERLRKGLLLYDDIPQRFMALL
jgi:hypothetical protein